LYLNALFRERAGRALSDPPAAHYDGGVNGLLDYPEKLFQLVKDLGYPERENVVAFLEPRLARGNRYLAVPRNCDENPRFRRPKVGQALRRYGSVLFYF